MADNITTDRNYLYPKRSELGPEPKPEPLKFGVELTLSELKILSSILFWTETGYNIKEIKVSGQARLLRKELEKEIIRAEQQVEAEKHKEPVCPRSCRR